MVKGFLFLKFKFFEIFEKLSLRSINYQFYGYVAKKKKIGLFLFEVILEHFPGQVSQVSAVLHSTGRSIWALYCPSSGVALVIFANVGFSVGMADSRALLSPSDDDPRLSVCS